MPTADEQKIDHLADFIATQLGTHIGRRLTIGQGALELAKALVAHEHEVVRLARAVVDTTPRGKPVVVDFEAFNQLDAVLQWKPT